MRRSLTMLALVGACGFSVRTGELDACTTTRPWWDARWAHRFAIDTAGAPASYPARFDASAALALSAVGGDDVRVIVDTASGARELDRVLDGSFVETRLPTAGTLWLYTTNPAAGLPPADPEAVYTWSESFETLALGDNGSARFDAQPTTDWRVVDDGGNRIYRVTGASRHPAPIVGLALADAEVRARLRVGPGGGQNHNGLLARASNTVPTTLDGYVGQMLEDVNYVRIAEYIDGISPPVERARFDRAVDRTTWYAMRMWVAGGVIELHIDGVLAARTALATSNGSLLGLFAHDTDVDYDDVRVRAIVDPEPAIALGALEDVPPCE